MRSVAIAFLLLASVASSGDEAAGKTGEVFLFVDPMRAVAANHLQLSGFVRIVAGRPHAKRSALIVTDSRGSVVFRDERAFMIVGETEIDLGAGFSSNGGPTLPESLPPGEYTARWTLDGHDSNAAHFTIGGGGPEPVRLEPLSSIAACAILHLYNAGPRDLALYDALVGSTLVVDSKRYARRNTLWIGSGKLRAESGWSALLFGDDYGVQLHGRHTLAIEVGGQRSTTLAVDCR
jgi:hypothetical protein